MVDICLILEGTYPYVVGGVSKWVDTLVRGLKDFEFAIVHLYTDEENRKARFDVPENVKEICEINVRNGAGFKFDFSDVRNLIPEARVYHSLSTGFAGLLGVQMKLDKLANFILTEHGLYWKELEFGVDEVECGFKFFADEKERRNLCVARRELAEIFKKIARECYRVADLVTTVCRFNLSEQFKLLGKEAGSFKRKFRVVNNFVDLERFYGLRARTEKNSCCRDVVFVGRVVPIKDVKTLIKSVPLVLKSVKNVNFYIVGDVEQDKVYVRECIELADTLGVVDKIHFSGVRDPVDFLRLADVFVLPSVSEAQPLALLEAMACGVPAVVTRTGGMPEIVENEKKCGFTFRQGDYELLADLIVQILTKDNLWKTFSQNGMEKAKQFDVKFFIESFKNIYKKFIS